jgi:hypothetical protein
MLYFIEQQNNRISLSEYDSDIKTFAKLKNNGEVWQEFEEKLFWKWFKKKIAYNGIALSFIVMTDKECFQLDESLTLALKNVVTKETLKHIMMMKSRTQTLLTFPVIENLVIPKIQEPLTKETPKVGEEKSMKDFFITQTIQNKLG